MKLLLGIWTLSHLLLSSSSSPCGNQEAWANTDDVPDEHTQELEEPWLVSILGNGQRCQGAVLNNWWILTAASCFLLMKPSYVELITTGEHFSTITVSQFLSHRGFTSWARPPINDLGLVMLGQPIDLRRREMWPVCIPGGNADSSLTWEHCRIHTRDQDGSKKWLKRIDVYILEMSECTTQWPGTSDQWNICMARKTNDEADCRVPVGSPVLCQNPAGDHWELRGIASQSSTNCSSPVLATQVVPHLEWLWGERILKNPVPPTLGYTETTRSSVFSPATEPPSMITPRSRDAFQIEEEEAAQQPATSPTEHPFETAITTSLETPTTTSQSPSKGLQLHAILPFQIEEEEEAAQQPATSPTGHPFETARATSLETATTTSQFPSKGLQLHAILPFQIEEEVVAQQPAKSPTGHPFETARATSLETPTTTSQSPSMGLQLPAILPFTGQIFGVPPTAAKGKQLLSEVMTHTTAGRSVPVKPSTEQPLVSATNQIIFVAHPTTKRLSPVTSTTTQSPVTPTMTKSPVTSTTTKLPVTSTTTQSPVTSTTKSPVTFTRTKPPVIPTTTKSPVTSTRTKSRVTMTKSHVTSTRTKSSVTSTRTKPPVTPTATKSPATTTTTKLPVTPTRRASHRQTSTLRPAKIIIMAHSTVNKSLTTRWTNAPSSEAPFTTNKQAYVIPSKKHLPRRTERPLTEKSTTAGQSSTSARPASSVASPTTKQSTVTPTTTQAALTVVHSHHVIIIPATPQGPLTSPASKKAPPADPPSPKPLVQMSVASPFIAAGPHVPKNKFQENVTPGPPPALLTSPNTAVPTTPLPLPRTHITMEQCELALAWNSVSQAYQLNEMADLMDRAIGCGLRPGFVAQCPGCSEAEAGEFPWVVSLTLSIQHFCAGSILNPWWILTTANCANLIKNSEALVLVQAGLVDISERTGSVPVRRALTHPGALANEDLHNLGLLQLQKPLEFGPRVAPVCISGAAHLMEDFRNCWLPSWTALQGGPARLLRRPLTILSICSCHQLEEKLSKAIFCIKAQEDQGGICKGDLGSPLICPDPQGRAWVQLGVLSSFDEACSRPYVFNSLQRYLPWLEETTKDHGRRDNYTVSWQRQGPALRLRVLQAPEALVGRISARSALAWQVLVATCRNRSCGGSILDRYWVLTTARCVQDTNPANTAVFVGLTHPKGHTQGFLVAGIYPYEGIPRSNISGGNVALLLLQDPIAFGKYATPMTLLQIDAWDSCKVMGLQTWEPGDAEPEPAAYQAKVLLASDCAKKHPGVNPATYCVVRSSAHYLPVATVGEGAALLCRREAAVAATMTPWSQVGITSEPFPGSQPDILSSSIGPYVEWMEETSKEAKHPLLLSPGRRTCGPSWALLLALPLFGGTALG